MTIAVIGAGIGGLTMALSLHKRGAACRVFEAAPQIKPLGVGINLLPHANRVLIDLGLEDALRACSVETKEAAFFDHHGMLIHREPLGVKGGFSYPQFSIHRGDLQMLLLAAVIERMGPDAVVADARCEGFTQDADGVDVRFSGAGAPADSRFDMVIGADGTHSVIRRQLHPDEGPVRYSGINMWRGATHWPAFLTGASMVRAGSLRIGKMVVYPIRDNVDDQGRQLVNWVAEIQSETYEPNDWNRPGRLEDFLPLFAHWRFDWLDVPALIQATQQIFEYPMVDRDPLPRWSFGRVTLMGDAAHPMYPRGSNGAAQSILDAEDLAERVLKGGTIETILTEYDAVRRPATAQVVLTNRTAPPDKVIEEVYDRTGGQPFARIEDVISAEELAEILGRYQRVAGWDRDSLRLKGMAAQ